MQVIRVNWFWFVLMKEKQLKNQDLFCSFSKWKVHILRSQVQLCGLVPSLLKWMSGFNIVICTSKTCLAILRQLSWDCIDLITNYYVQRQYVQSTPQSLPSCQRIAKVMPIKTFLNTFVPWAHKSSATYRSSVLCNNPVWAIHVSTSESYCRR